MTLQLVNLGNYANDGTGDDLRTAFQKVNANFQILNTETNISNGTNLGSGVGLFKDRNVANLEFKSLTSTGNTVSITSTANTVNLETTTTLENDLNPTLAGTLNLNNHYVYGGDVQTSIFGINVPIMNGLLELLLQSNTLAVDMGTILIPTGSKTTGDKGTNLDMGYISTTTYLNNNLNFGNFVN
jgi:hypothetical protein